MEKEMLNELTDQGSTEGFLFCCSGNERTGSSVQFSFERNRGSGSYKIDDCVAIKRIFFILHFFSAFSNVALICS
jgi:hypothetical protein